ncbi:hypothetical protein Cme02nite_29330 [Catellatospora methionotrophica]|uniref:Uncharacterized protein n=1 Tax=Catellatospora methionotrophica TaxID=121620 RepID=A0A8J3LG94_9ACTN|nr:hypothetical protein [Catellatospora methionotrophica]GIG14601.1 hypothetical protein Cme02nite_29330 [Catellatospora methionotrophica]
MSDGSYFASTRVPASRRRDPMLLATAEPGTELDRFLSALRRGVRCEERMGGQAPR